MPVKEVRRLDRVLGKHPDVYRSFRRLSIQLIVSLFCLGSLCLLGGLLFQWTERGFEETYKCGETLILLARVNKPALQKSFIDFLAQV